MSLINDLEFEIKSNRSRFASRSPDPVLDLGAKETTRLQTLDLAQSWRRAALDLHDALDRLSLFFKAGFDPDQPRDPQGRWTGGGGALIRAAGRATLRTALILARRNPVGRAISTAIFAAEHIPYVQAYFDRPKTLDELQREGIAPKRGYDIHHIVEQTAARNSGFGEEAIDGPSNLVRISTFKHWEITAWYATGNLDFGGLSPRQYLVDQSWDERYRVGLKALSSVGILKP